MREEGRGRGRDECSISSSSVSDMLVGVIRGDLLVGDLGASDVVVEAKWVVEGEGGRRGEEAALRQLGQPREDVSSCRGGSSRRRIGWEDGVEDLGGRKEGVGRWKRDDDD